MQNYTATEVYTSDENSKLVMVTSKRCQYRVSFDGEEVEIAGPGVNESDDRDDLEFYSIEDAAIHYVLMWESGLWPSD